MRPFIRTAGMLNSLHPHSRFGQISVSRPMKRSGEILRSERLTHHHRSNGLYMIMLSSGISLYAVCRPVSVVVDTTSEKSPFRSCNTRAITLASFTSPTDTACTQIRGLSPLGGTNFEVSNPSLSLKCPSREPRIRRKRSMNGPTRKDPTVTTML